MATKFVRLNDGVTAGQRQWLTRQAKKAGVSRATKLREVLSQAMKQK